MKIPYLIKRFLTFLIDVIFLYSWGLIFYFIMKDKPYIHNQKQLLDILILFMFFIVISQETFYAFLNFSLGQKIMGLRMEHFKFKKFRFFPALIRANLLSLIVVPFLEPLIQIILALIFAFSSIGTYKNKKLLFIDVLTGISVVEDIKREE